MRILHVTKKYPNALGGDAVVVASLQKEQNSNRHRTSILTSRCPEIIDGKNIFKFGFTDSPESLDEISLKRLLSLVALTLTTFKVLKKVRPDIIHTHSVDMAAAVWPAARIFNIPIVHTFHIMTFHDNNQPMFKRKVELILLSVAKPKSVLIMNRYDFGKLSKTGKYKCVEVENGVDLSFWKKESEHKVKPASSKFTILAVGRLEHQKGLEYLIDGVYGLDLSIRENVEVIIVGDGSLKSSLQQSINLKGLDTIIKLVGSKNRNQLKQLYQDAGMVVISSLYEMSQLTLLESWAMQVPVGSTKVGILQSKDPEFKSMYFEIEKSNAASVTNCINALVADESLRQSLSSAGSEFVKNKGWSQVNANIEKIYSSVVTGTEMDSSS